MSTPTNPDLVKPTETSVLMTILKDTFQWKLIKSLILPILGLIVLFSVIAALLNLITLSMNWRISELKVTIDSINAMGEDYVLTDADTLVVTEYTQLAYMVVFLGSSFQFIPLLSLLVFTTGKIYFDYTKNYEAPHTWMLSLRAGFTTQKQSFTTIIMLIFLVILIPIGLVMLYIPGFLLMIYFFFSFHAIVLDKKEGREAFRGGAFYAKENVAKIIVILFIFVFIPILINLYIGAPIRDQLNFTQMNFQIWITPETRDYGMYFLYGFVTVFTQNIFYLFFPIVYAIAFHHIREEKIGAKEESKKKVLIDQDGVKIISITEGQRYYRCTNCGQRVPISASKCFKCGQLYKLSKI